MLLTACQTHGVEATRIVNELKEKVQAGYNSKVLQKNPHMVLLRPEFYEESLKEVLAQWTYLWLLRQNCDLDQLSRKDTLSYITGPQTDEIKNIVTAAELSQLSLK